MAVARMLLLLLLLPCSRAELVQVHLLTHHGAHGLPYATPTLSDLDRIPSAADLRWPWPGVYSSPNNQGPPLTTFGQAQLYSVGQHLRNRFMDSCTSGGVFCLLSGVDPPSAETVYIRATDLDRTLESAEALQRSLFPADPHRSPRPLHLPVHTVPQMDDVSNRAHVLCHAFRQSVAAWQRSSTFAAKVQEVEPFLETLRSAFEESYKGPIELATWGEFYEYVSGGRAEAPETMPSLNASDWDQIDALADWTETALYGSHAVAGTYVGGPALSEIAVGMKWAVAQVTPHGHAPPKLLYNSAQYSLLLGIAAALNVSLPGGKLPPPGAMMAFELHKVEDQYYVQLVYQAGSSASIESLPLPCTYPTPAPLPSPMCSHEAFAALAASAGYAAPVEWCDACGNVAAGPCAAARAALPVPSPQYHHDDSSGGDLWVVWVCLAVGVASCFVGMTGERMWLQRVRPRLKARMRPTPEERAAGQGGFSLKKLVSRRTSSVALFDPPTPPGAEMEIDHLYPCGVLPHHEIPDDEIRPRRAPAAPDSPSITVTGAGPVAQTTGGKALALGAGSPTVNGAGSPTFAGAGPVAQTTGSGKGLALGAGSPTVNGAGSPTFASPTFAGAGPVLQAPRGGKGLDLGAGLVLEVEGEQVRAVGSGLAFEHGTSFTAEYDAVSPTKGV